MAAGLPSTAVLNTDNMNLYSGESFDYGPYRFLPRNDPNFTAAYFDETGLYAFGRQPEAMFWNLRQLAGALTLVTPAEPLVEVINTFSGAYRSALAASMLRRLGLAPRSPDEDIDLVNAAFKALAEGGAALRWEPFFFDWFGGLASEPSRARKGLEAGDPAAVRQCTSELAPGLRLRMQNGPNASHRLTSPRPSRKSCSTTKSKRSGPQCRA